MIKTWRHKGLQRFFTTGTTRGIQAAHARRLTLQLSALNAASGPQDMAAPNWRCHPLHDDLAGHWSVWVNGNWRLTFTFDENGDAVLVDYQDYH